MPRILVSASFAEAELVRETPGGSGHWEDFEFIFAPSDQPVDGWVVYDNLRNPLEQLCPPENTLLLTYEPASVRRYRSRFTSQFAQVWTVQSNIKHRHVTYANEAQRRYYSLNESQGGWCPFGFRPASRTGLPDKAKTTKRHLQQQTGHTRSS